MVEAATNFKKSGYSEEDSAALARVATLYQNIADEQLTAGDSADFIISQMKAFNIEASDAESIINKVNEVSNNYAVSSTDLAKGLQLVSAALSIGGNNLDEVLGLMTGGVEITRNATKMARGLVSVQSRLNQITDESSSVGQALSTWYEEHGIDVYDKQTGQIRSLYEILSDLAPMWDELSKNEQAYYLNQQAGANQTQNLAAILENFDTVVNATSTSLNDSLGSAIQENSRYMESLEARTNLLKAEFQDFANNVIDKELVQGALSMLSGALEVLNTDVGQAATQFVLLTGIIGGGLVIFGQIAAKIASGVVMLKNFSTILTIIQGAFTGATVSATAFASAVFPIAGIVAGIAVAGYKIWNSDWFKKIFREGTYVEDKIGEINTQISETKDKIEELKQQGASQNVIDIYSEKLDGLEKQLSEFNKKKLDLSFGETFTTQEWDGANGGWIDVQNNVIEDSIKKLNDLKKAMSEAASTEEYERLEQQYYDNYEALKKYYDIGKEANDSGVEFTETERNLWYQLVDLFGTVDEVVQKELDLKVAQADNVYTAIGYTKQLYNEAEQLGITKEEMANLIVQTIAFNNTNLSVDQKISELQRLGMMADITGAKLANIGTGSAEYSDYINNALSEGLSIEEAQNQYVSYIWGKWNRKSVAPSGVDENDNGDGGGGTPTTKSQKQEKSAVEQANDAWKEQLALLKDRLELMEKSGASDEAQIDQMRKIQDAIHKQAEVYRQLGLDEDSEYLRELGLLWWDYENDIQKIYDNIADKAKEAAEETRKAWEEALEEEKSNYETAASYVLDKIDDEIEALQKQRDAEEEAWDAKIQALKDANSELEDQIKYEELLNNLAQAKNKKLYVYSNGQFQYVQDVEAISAAQAELDAYDRDRALEQEVANLEKLKKQALANIDDQIKGWEDYKDEWKDVVNQYTNQQNKLIAEQVLGIDLEQKNWQKRLMNAQEFADKYNNIMANLKTASAEGAVEAVGGSSKMSSSDLSALAQAGRDYNSAKTQAEKDAAHARAEAIRNKYGYSGGTDGSKYIPTSGGLISSKKSSGSSSKKSSSKTVTSSSSSGGGRVSQDIGGRATHPERYAGGTLSAVGGISMVGEQGPELRVLGQGDGILPADITRNLWNWGKISPGSLLNQATSHIFNINNLTLPNARDAESLITGLKQMAYQRAYKRA